MSSVRDKVIRDEHRKSTPYTNTRRHVHGLPAKPMLDVAEPMRPMNPRQRSGRNDERHQRERTNQNTPYLERQLGIAFPKLKKEAAGAPHPPCVRISRPSGVSASTDVSKLGSVKDRHPANQRPIMDQQIMNGLGDLQGRQTTLLRAFGEVQEEIMKIQANVKRLHPPEASATPSDMQTLLLEMKKMQDSMFKMVAHAYAGLRYDIGVNRSEINSQGLSLEKFECSLQTTREEMANSLWTKGEAQEAYVKWGDAQGRMETYSRDARNEMRSAREDISDLHSLVEACAGKVTEQLEQSRSEVDSLRTEVKKVKEEFSEVCASLVSLQENQGRDLCKQKRRIIIENDGSTLEFTL